MSTDIAPPHEGSSPIQCSSTTGRGERCKAWAVKGKTVCRAHGMTAEEKSELVRRGREARTALREAREDAEVSQRMGLRALLGARLEEEAEAVTARLRTLALSPDDGVALQGLKLWLERVHGRAVQPTADVTVDMPTDDVELARMTPEERRSLIAVLRKAS
jgi:multidrug efflux pump subunit AcrA (membrane-fusion protein)